MGYRLDFNADAIMKRVYKATAEAMETEVARVAEEVRRLAPVGTVTRALPTKYFQTNSRAVRKATGQKFKRDEDGRLISRDYIRAPKPWKARNPGTLRDSVYTKVRWRNGVCLGFVKAGYDRKRGEGDPNAFYAAWVEFGTKNMRARPFFRPGVAKARAENVAAAMRGALQ